MNKISETALKMFFSITDKWKLNNKQKMKLLGMKNSTIFFNLKEYKCELNEDNLERISYITGIYKDLQILLPDTADDWVNKENNIFDGSKPINVILSGNINDLYKVRKYLDAELGTLYD